jgi:hypothetical protein
MIYLPTFIVAFSKITQGTRNIALNALTLIILRGIKLRTSATKRKVRTCRLTSLCYSLWSFSGFSKLKGESNPSLLNIGGGISFQEYKVFYEVKNGFDCSFDLIIRHIYMVFVNAMSFQKGREDLLCFNGPNASIDFACLYFKIPVLVTSTRRKSLPSYSLSRRLSPKALAVFRKN